MLTLICDASFGGPGVAGWGAWAKADGREAVTQGGLVKVVRVGTSVEAELAALLYGLRLARRYAPDERTILMQSDCHHALLVVRERLGFEERPHRDGLVLTGGKVRLSPAEAHLLTGFEIILAESWLKVLVRHVKGHVVAAKGRHWVNTRCDQLARRYMRQARDRVTA